MLLGSLCTGYSGLDMAVQAVLGGGTAWAPTPAPSDGGSASPGVEPLFLLSLDGPDSHG